MQHHTKIILAYIITMIVSSAVAAALGYWTYKLLFPVAMALTLGSENFNIEMLCPGSIMGTLTFLALFSLAFRTVSYKDHESK